MEDIATNKNKIYIASAIAVPLFLSWLLVQIQFWLGANVASPIGVFLAILSGTYLASKIHFLQNKYKALFWLVYLSLLILSALFIGLLTSCANGDCI